jgi:sporulation protein YlmC with PRC-barrel domain
MMTAEVHIERVIGTRVRDIDGQIVGRIEEICVDTVDGESVVTEWHIGPAAFIERLGGTALRLPLLGWLPFERFEYRVPWRLLDLSRPDCPRLKCSKADLTAWRQSDEAPR